MPDPVAMPREYRVAFGSRMRDRRRAARITQQQLADDVHASRQHIWQLEKAVQGPSRDLVMLIAPVLEWDVEEALECAGFTLPPHEKHQATAKQIVGQQIAAARERSNLRQEDVARHLGITRAAVGNWEAGRTTPDSVTLGRLASILNVSTDDLVRTGDPPTESDSIQSMQRKIADLTRQVELLAAGRPVSTTEPA